MRIEGIVIHGKQLGRTIGFPTANIRVLRLEDPGSNGVYAARCRVKGAIHPCMMNIGLHPTVPEGDPSIEVHIFHYDGDLYDLPITVETVCFLRGEEKFSSVEALRLQLEQDKTRALAILSGGNGE